MLQLAWLIPLFPLIACILLLAGRKKWNEVTASGIGSLAVLASLAVSGGVLMEQWGRRPGFGKDISLAGSG